MNIDLSDPFSIRGQVNRYYRDSFIYMMVSFVVGTLFVLFLYQSVESTIICLVFSVGCFYQSLALPIKTSEQIDRQYKPLIVSLEIDQLASSECSHQHDDKQEGIGRGSVFTPEVEIENLKMARTKLIRSVRGYAINVASFWLSLAFAVAQLTVISVSIFGN